MDAINNVKKQMPEINPSIFNTGDRIPDEILKRFLEYQFKEWLYRRYLTGKTYQWRNMDISGAIINGLHFEIDDQENENFFQLLLELLEKFQENINKENDKE